MQDGKLIHIFTHQLNVNENTHAIIKSHCTDKLIGSYEGTKGVGMCRLFQNNFENNRGCGELRIIWEYLEQNMEYANKMEDMCNVLEPCEAMLINCT